MDKANQKQGIEWNAVLAEMAGTAILVLVGLSVVIFMFGEGSPMNSLIPDVTYRRIITGFSCSGRPQRGPRNFIGFGVCSRHTRPAWWIAAISMPVAIPTLSGT